MSNPVRPVVSVRGHAALESPPETATVHASVLVRDKTRERAEQRLVELSAAVGEAIARHEGSVRRHSASAVSVYPIMRTRRNDKPQSYE